MCRGGVFGIPGFGIRYLGDADHLGQTSLTTHVYMYSLCRVFPLLRCFIVTLSETRRYEHHWRCHDGSSNKFKSKQIPARVLRAPAPPIYHLCMVAELGFHPRIPK